MKLRWSPREAARGAAVALLLLLTLAGCGRPSSSFEELQPADGGGGSLGNASATPATASSPFRASPTATRAASVVPGVAPVSPTPAVPAAGLAAATPFFQGAGSPACGQLLPILPASLPLVSSLAPEEAIAAEVASAMPEAAQSAFERILAAPETVGLAAYRVGQESQGVFLNAEAPMPLASVVKLIHLVAYVEAVAAGELNPNEQVSLEELESYYLPRLDLGAHAGALAELREEGRLLENPPGVRLEEVPWMMIRHSSNAAMDYLHMRLGQQRIEETAIELGLSSQTAPCPFLGQFLAMSNHTRLGRSDLGIVQEYVAEPARYGHEVMLLTEAFSMDPAFRERELSRQQRPSPTIQRYFSEHLNPQASAAEYAGLMARIAQNGLNDGESSFLARRYLEWPMRFPANQALFSNLGYKNGSMPGILTTVYYAYPKGETVPIVVALFFRDLPNRTYQQWRRNVLAHDELARWLLADPSAIPLLREVVAGS